MVSFFFGCLLSLIFLLLIFGVCYYYYIANYPKFRELTGPYKFIGVSYHRTANSVRFKLYYPSSKFLIESNRSETPKYFKNINEAAKGSQHLIAAFASINIPLFMIKSLSLLKHKKFPPPCYEDAPIFIANNNNSINSFNCQYPLILLSHGMGGSWDFYTQISCNLASFGLIVAVIEHNDGSASHAKTSFGTDMYYVSQHILNSNGVYSKPKLSKWTRKHTIKFRGKQTDKRVDNMCNVYQYLVSLINSTDVKLEKLKVPYIDFNHVFVMGHSFGGITAVMTAKKLQDKLCGCIVFEPWFEPKSDNDLMKKWKLPYLVIIGDRWTQIQSLWNTMILIIESNTEKEHNKCFQHFKGFTHIDFCDGCLMGPQWILRKLGCCSKLFNIKQAQDLLIKRCVQFIANLSPEWKDSLMTHKKCYIITETERNSIRNIDKSGYNIKCGKHNLLKKN